MLWQSQRVLLALFLLALVTATVHATALAAGPDVRALLPAGGQRGTTVEVDVSFKTAKWPVQAWVDSPGLTITAGEEKNKLSVAIAADAAPGLRWIRLYDGEGSSAPLPFVVGTLAEVGEKEPNDAPHEAQEIGSSTTVVNGRLEKSGDVDVFMVPLSRGQTLVASLAGHETLGSPMDAVLHVVSAGGFQLAYNHDSRGLDPEITFTAPSDGLYGVRVFAFPSAPNSSIRFSGSPDYVYRLTLTTGPFVDYAWPLAVTRGSETPVELHGWNVPDALATTTVTAEGDRYEITDPQLGNVVDIAVEPHTAPIESEPNAPETPQTIALPSTLSGRIEQPGDVDAFAFDAKKDETIVFTLESRSLGYPLDGVLELTDAEGKSLSRVDDAGGERDPVATFKAPADGTFRVQVSDLNYQGSSRHVYRLRATPAEPDYQVTADAHAYTLAADKPVEITMAIDRRHGFAEEIQITATGLPEFVAAEPAVSAASGDSAKSVKLKLTSSGGAFSGPVRFEARATGESKLERTATAAIPNLTERTPDVWLTVAPPKEPDAAEESKK